MRFLILSIILVLSSLPIFAGETAGEDDAAVSFSGDIVIGATFPRSGFLEDYGLSAYYGANTAVRMTNAAGGINGKRLVLEWRDNASDPDLAEQQVRELAEQFRVPAVLGPLMSDSALRVRPVARELGVTIVSPMATLDQLPEKDPWVFRACFNNSATVDALVRFQRDKYGASSCAILYDPRYAFSLESARSYEKKITTEGGACLGVFSILAKNGEKDYATPMAAIAALGPDYIFAPCYAVEATEMIQQAKIHNLNIRFCGHYTWDNQVVFEGSGTRLAGTSFASALFEQAFSRSFRTFYSAMEAAGMDTPDASAALAYDAVMLLAEAMKNGETAEQIREGLLSIRNHMLATGRITITETGDSIKPVLVRVVERNGYRLEPVYAERYDPPRRTSR